MQIFVFCVICKRLLSLKPKRCKGAGRIFLSGYSGVCLCTSAALKRKHHLFSWFMGWASRDYEFSCRNCFKLSPLRKVILNHTPARQEWIVYGRWRHIES